MFSSAYFPQEYFNEYFKITGEVIRHEDDGGSSVSVNWQQLKALKLRKGDEDILEFIVAFVLSRR